MWFIAAVGSAVLFGLTGFFMKMKALENGPASLTAPLMNLNILLVILMSVTIYGEHVHSTEAGGIVLLIASAVLVSIKLKEP